MVQLSSLVDLHLNENKFQVMPTVLWSLTTLTVFAFRNGLLTSNSILQRLHMHNNHIALVDDQIGLLSRLEVRFQVFYGSIHLTA